MLHAIDLTTGTVAREELPQEVLRQYLGGRGINAWMLSRLLGRDVDPFGPENVLVFSAGLLTGSEAPASSRLHVGALSPLTGLLGSSNVGGHFGAALHSSGVQTLAVRGRGEQPVMLWIDGGRRRGPAGRSTYGAWTRGSQSSRFRRSSAERPD